MPLSPHSGFLPIEHLPNWCQIRDLTEDAEQPFPGESAARQATTAMPYSSSHFDAPTIHEEDARLQQNAGPRRDNALPDSLDQPAPRSLRILVVEDHCDTLRILLHFLTHLGHEVRGAPTVREAFQIADQWDFETLLCDIGLSDGDGCNFTRELRATKKFWAIAMSGYSNPADMERSVDAGFDRFLVKPFAPARLESILAELGLRT